MQGPEPNSRTERLTATASWSWSMQSCFRFLLGLVALLLIAPLSFPFQDELVRGDALRRDGKFQDAIDLYTAFLAKTKDNATAYEGRGRAYWGLAKRKEAEQDFTAALKIEPTRQRVWNARGYLRMHMDPPNHKGARDDLLRAVELNDKDADSWAGLGLAYLYLEDWDRSIEANTRAISLNPNDVRPWINRGSVYETKGNLAKALENYDQAVRVDPANGMTHAYRGDAKKALGDLEGALIDYAHAAQLQPQFWSERLKNLRSEMGAKADKIEVPPLSTSAKVTPPAATKGIPLPPRDFFEKLPSLKWPPPDVDKEATWPAGDVLYTRPAPPAIPQLTAQPLNIPAPLDIDKLRTEDFRAAVIQAREGMRLMYGPMRPSETAAFEAKWAPYLNLMSSEMADYLNKLNPLLARFLAARAGVSESARMLQSTLVIGQYTAAMKDAPEALSGLRRRALVYKAALDGYQAELTLICRQIIELGNPPNPFDLHRRRKHRFDQEIDRMNKLAIPTSAPTGQGKTAYALVGVTTREIRRLPDGKGEAVTVTIAPGKVQANISYVVTDNYQRTLKGKLKVLVTWDPLPGVVDEVLGKSEIALPFRVEKIHEELSDLNLKSERKTIDVEVLLSTTNMPTDGAYQIEFPYNDEDTKVKTLEARFFEDDEKRLKTEFLKNGLWPVVVKVSLRDIGEFEVTYSYKKLPVTSEQRRDLQIEAEKIQAIQKEAAGGQDQAFAAGAAAKQARIDDLAFQADMIAFFRSRSEQLMADAQRAGDAKAGQALRLGALAAEANQRAFEDERHFLETGERIFTRTAWDDYNFVRMLEIGKLEAAQARLPNRYVEATYQQIRLAPQEDQRALLEEYGQALTASGLITRDVSKLKSLYEGISNKVQAANLKQAGAEIGVGNTYRGLEIAGYGTQMAAGAMVIGVGGAVLAGAGAAGATLWAGETLLGAAYGGCTGYAEGGVTEASKQALEWSGALGLAANQAMESWAETGDKSEAAQSAALTLLAAAGLQVGAEYLTGTGFFDGAKKALAAERAALRAEIEQSVESGKVLAKKWQDAEFALQKAVGNKASAAEIQKLTQAATEAATEANASFGAKLWLKQHSGTGTGRAWEGRLGPIYSETTDDMLKLLSARGYDVTPLKFQPIRNASSAGSVSMDLDLMLIESEDLVIRKTVNGKTVTVSKATLQKEAQEAFAEAYLKKTGQSAEASFLNVTSTAHMEAFTNPEWLAKEIDFDRICSADVIQMGEVVTGKVADIPLQGGTKFIENCRGLEKEMRTKLFPFLEARIRQAKAAQSTVLAKELEDSLKFWRQFYDEFAVVSKDAHPDKVMQVYDRVRMLSGGKSLFEVADRMRFFLEGLAKFK